MFDSRLLDLKPQPSNCCHWLTADRMLWVVLLSYEYKWLLWQSHSSFDANSHQPFTSMTWIRVYSLLDKCKTLFGASLSSLCRCGAIQCLLSVSPSTQWAAIWCLLCLSLFLDSAARRLRCLILLGLASADSSIWLSSVDQPVTSMLQ